MVVFLLDRHKEMADTIARRKIRLWGEDMSSDGERSTDTNAGAGGNVLWGSDVIASAMAEQNIPYACLNPGASYRGLHDSLVNYLGNANPQMVVCMHEEHCIAIPHGYAMVTGQPLFAIVHSNVGLMHATMGIFNAWCARVPVIVLGATGPVDAAKRRPWIDWIHTSADQGALVRGYTKWDDQPASPQAAVESIRRAALIAQSYPCGPVYVNLDAAMQETALDSEPKFGPVNLYAAPESPEPPRKSVAAAVEVLAGAKSAVMLSGRGPRTMEHWNERVALAERIGARVITNNGDAASFPSSHPLYAGEMGLKLSPGLASLVRDADVILCVDWVDPSGTIEQVHAPGEGPKVVSISGDYLVHNGWSMDYQRLPALDVWLACAPETGVRALVEGLDARGIGPRELYKPRPRAAIEPAASTGPVTITDLAKLVRMQTAKQPTSIISTPIGWPPNAVEMEHPLDYLGGRGGGGVGGGPGMAVGAAMALRDMGEGRIPVAVLGDGDFTMGNNALWTAANQKAPLLVITANNRSYYNDEEHQKHVARARTRPEENAPIGQRIDEPAPDLAAMAKSMGWEGEGPIESMADLPAALDRAFAAVKAGKCFVLDVVIDREYVRKPLVNLV